MDRGAPAGAPPSGPKARTWSVLRQTCLPTPMVTTAGVTSTRTTFAPRWIGIGSLPADATSPMGVHTTLKSWPKTGGTAARQQLLRRATAMRRMPCSMWVLLALRAGLLLDSAHAYESATVRAAPPRPCAAAYA